MTDAKYWKEHIKSAVFDAERGKPESLDLIAKNLEMLDDAKQELRNKGYGWTGLDILETAKQVRKAKKGKKHEYRPV